MTEHAVTHEPVLLDEVLEILKTQVSVADPILLDGTLGLGGYSEAILKTFPNGHVLGLDRDPNAIARAIERLAPFGSRFTAIHANFSSVAQVMQLSKDRALLSAVVLDLGVSNMQIAEGERGFSFQQDGPLDMRMDPEGDGMTAAEVIAVTSEQELTRIFRDYGDERYAKRIASGIVAARKQKLLSTTGELVALIRDVLPEPVQRKMGGHPARRVFQALRIFVNNELSELEAVLDAIPEIAAPGCVVIIVSYHSLEDRIVKHRFREWERPDAGSAIHNHDNRMTGIILPVATPGLGKVLTRHPVLPQDSEIERNYKARSAKLRACRFD